jgi:hypothetical protein
MKTFALLKPWLNRSTTLSLFLSVAILAVAFFAGSLVVAFLGMFLLWSILLLLRIYRKPLGDISKWAGKHPVRSQFVIAGIQLFLTFVGIMLGKNLLEMGFNFSMSSAYLLVAILIACFMAVPFLPKKELIVIPQVLIKRRLAYVGISLSFFMLMILAGNNIENIMPGSSLANLVDRTDQFFFQETEATSEVPNHLGLNLYLSAPEQAEQPALLSFTSAFTLSVLGKKQEQGFLKRNLSLIKKLWTGIKAQFKKRIRLLASSGACFAAILGILALVVLVCAGVCLILFGLEGDITLVLAGAALTGLSIWGIIELAKFCVGTGKNSG